MPPVKQGSAIAVDVMTTAGSVQPPLFSWRTIDRAPGHKLIEYKGSSEFLKPADFSEFWEKARAELKAVPENARVTRVPDKDSTTGLLYKVQLDSLENTTIVGWMYVPKAAYNDTQASAPRVSTKFPAIIINPGYDHETPPIDKTAEGYITFSSNPRNHGPSMAYWKAPVEQFLYNIAVPDKYYYKLADLDCLRAAQFVLARPEVEKDRVACEGSSQGGYFALATAALEPRIHCAVVDLVAFSDYGDGFLLATIGHHTAIKKFLIDNASSSTAIRRSLALTDGANLATMVKCPVEINMGGLDPVAPYVCGIAAYNRLASSHKEYHVDPSATHDKTTAISAWGDTWLRQWLSTNVIGQE